MKLLPADIILVKNRKGLFGKAILAVMNFFQDDLVEYQHIMLAINDKECVEALFKVKVSITRDRFKGFSKYEIIRCDSLTEAQRRAIANQAEDLVGLRYSVLRVFLQLFDQTFNTNYFTKRIKDPNQQICSSLVAWCYSSITGMKFNRVNWASCEPDDIADHVEGNSDTWHTILEYEDS